MIEITSVPDKAAKEVGGQCCIWHLFKGQTLRCVECVIEILQVRDRTAFGDEISLYHSLAVKLEDAALGKASPQGLPDLGRIRSPALSEEKRLGDGSNRDADNDLVGELGKLPCSVRTYMDGPAHDFQYRLHAGERPFISTGHDRESSLLGPDGTA
jgi:hypothetical protein